MSAVNMRSLRYKIRFILKNAEAVDDFVAELAEASVDAIQTGKYDALVQLIDEWYATADVDSIPRLREKALKAHRQIKGGRAPASWSRYRKDQAR